MNYKKFKKSNLITQKEREKMLLKASSQANLLLSVVVLHDCFNFGGKRLEKFLDDYQTLSISCENGDDNWKAMVQNIKDRYNIKIV